MFNVGDKVRILSNALEEQGQTQTIVGIDEKEYPYLLTNYCYKEKELERLED